MAIILKRNFGGIPPDDFLPEVRRRAASFSGASDFIYIVPTRRRVRELQRELVTGVTFGKLPIYTLELFAHELFMMMSTGRRVISPSMQGMIVGRVLSEGEYRFFKYASFRPGARKGAAPVGTIKKIVDQIGYLEENGITPEDYRSMASVAEESERLKLEEFYRIYREYISQLGDRLVDSAGILSLVNERLAASRELLDLRFPGNLTAFVEGFYNFKKPELDFLHLVSWDERFAFLVKLDCNESNGNLFRTMISTSNDLAVRGFQLQEKSQITGSPSGREISDFLSLNLFRDDPPAEKVDMRGQIFEAGVRDTLREAEFVTEKIKEIVQRDPAQKLDRICVASYLPQNYTGIFREVFRKYRVPANITDRFTLESNGIVNAILSFIDIKASDYERVTLMRAITNRMLTVSDEFGADRAGGVIYDAARICRFERGLRNFRDSIDSKLEFMKRLGSSENDDGAGEAMRNADALVKARKILDEIESRLAGLNGILSPEDFRKKIKRLVNELGVHGNIVKLDPGGIPTEIVERDARALAAFFEVLDEVVEVETERSGERLSLPIWLESLRAALSLTRFNVRQKYGYGVYVTSLDEIRGLEFDYLFIVGLNEGELPAKYNPEIFLPLRSQDENRETEPFLQRHLFYQAVSSFKKELYLVYPVQREEVKLFRSSFIDALNAVADITQLKEGAGESRTKNIYDIHQLIEADSAIEGAREKIASDESSAKLLPPNLNRCIRAEAARYRGDSESEFAGRITEPELVSDLSERLAKRVFSAAQLESLSRCGFQFFAGRILGAAEMPEIETSLSPIERGAVLHKILYKFYSELSNRKNLAGAKEELDLLLSVAREVLDGLGIWSDGSFGRDLFEVERDTILGTKDSAGTLELFLAKVQSKLTEYGFQPKSFEVGFGMKGGDGEVHAAPVEIGGVQVRGKIDRIDAGPNGLMIFDYKTSARNATHQDVIREKISPQLLIYMNALSKLMESAEAAEQVSGAAFISINRERLIKEDSGSKLIDFIVREDAAGLQFNKTFESIRKTTSTDGYPASMKRLLEETESFVKQKVGSARSGRFNLTQFPPVKVCVYCPYIEACRIKLGSEGADAEENGSGS